jgi:hypothetical protein
MAKAEYIISLIKVHYNNEPECFTILVLQIATQVRDDLLPKLMSEKISLKNI